MKIAAGTMLTVEVLQYSFGRLVDNLDNVRKNWKYENSGAVAMQEYMYIYIYIYTHTYVHPYYANREWSQLPFEKVYTSKICAAYELGTSEIGIGDIKNYQELWISLMFFDPSNYTKMGFPPP